MQGMHEHHKVEGLRRLVDGPERWRANWRSIDMRANLEPAEAECLDMLNLPDRTRCILHADHANACEPSGCLLHHARDVCVHDLPQSLCGLGLQPVRQQFRHRREDVNVDAIPAHVSETARHIPAPRIDPAKHLAADHHVGVFAFARDARPQRSTPSIGGDVRGNYMRMHVDDERHEGLFPAYIGTKLLLEPHMQRLVGSKPNWRGRCAASSWISSTPTEYSNTMPFGPRKYRKRAPEVGWRPGPNTIGT